jgi:hypothetical protein
VPEHRGRELGKAVGLSALTFVLGLVAGLFFAALVLLLGWKSPGDWPPWSFLIVGGALAFGFAMIRLTAYWRASFAWPLIGTAAGFILPWMLLIFALCSDGQCSGE